MPLNYSYPQIVFTEVPGEISLALSISGCNIGCEHCHSSFTHDPSYGTPLTYKEIDKLLSKYVTCVLFYGGEWNIDELIDLLKYVKSKNLKTCLYTGKSFKSMPVSLLRLLDFIKVNPYNYKLGGLQSPDTNQKFYYLSDSIIIGEHKFYNLK